jgi:PAS domain S-box-containing protein
MDPKRRRRSVRPREEKHPRDSGFERRPFDVDAGDAIGAWLGGEGERSRLYASLAGSMVLLLDRDHRVRMINESGADLLGMGTPDAMLGRRWFDEFVPIRVRNRLRTGFIEALGKDEVPSTFEGPILTARGEERVMAWRCAAVRDVVGRPIGVLAAGTDITRARVMEKLDRQRLEVERLAAIGQLVAGVAHGINNPLAAVKNAFRIVADAVPPNHPDRSYVPLIQAEIVRITELVQVLYKLRPPERGAERRGCHRAAVDDAIRLCGDAAAERGVTFSVSHGPEGAAVRATDSELRQAILNITANAVAASPRGGTVSIRVETDSPNLVFVVSDEGPGIPPDVLPRVFEPFFTTDTSGEHVGLGLSIALGLVRGLGGDIEITSVPGAGTTFSVALPLAP